MRVQHLPRPRRHAPWRVAFIALHVAGLAAVLIALGAPETVAPPLPRARALADAPDLG